MAGMMKLHWSPRSPFVRKVMVVAHDVGVAGIASLVSEFAHLVPGRGPQPPQRPTYLASADRRDLHFVFLLSFWLKAIRLPP